jgi:hypothetical protein
MRRHRADLVSLVLGLVFVALGVRFLQPGAQLWSIDWSWAWPAVLLLAGLVVLASARSRDREPDAVADQPLEDPAGPVAP